MKQKPYITLVSFIFLPSSIFIQAAKTPSQQCGLPPFVSDLPTAEKKEVLAVWKDYKSGDCTDQRRETQEIIDNLSSDVRAVIFSRPPSFLKGASTDVKKLFRDIMHNKTLSYENKNQELSKLANQVLNQRQLTEFKRYLDENERRKKEFEEKLNNLSPAAKETYEKLERLKIERAKIAEEMSEDVRKELRELYRKRKNQKRTKKNS